MGDLKEKYESFKEQVRQAADIVSVVSETVDLKKKGRRFWGMLPFPLGKNAFFYRESRKGLFSTALAAAPAVMSSPSS